jgi:hypothetical protein
MIKSRDTRLVDIHANPSGSKAFIIADAKDADMAFVQRDAACAPVVEHRLVGETVVL